MTIHAALGLIFAIEGSEGTTEDLAPLRESFATATGEPSVRLVLDPSLDAALAFSDDERSVSAKDPGLLLSEINGRVIARHLASHLLLHAGGVDIDGVIVALPGRPGSGKTTLTAALVARGARYLSDEIVPIDRASQLVEPYAKPLTLRSGTTRLLGLPAPMDDRGERLVTARALGGHPADGGGRLGAVVLPAFERDRADVVLEPFDPAAGLYATASNLGNLRELGGVGLVELAAVLTGVPVYAARYGDATVAADAVIRLLRS